MQFVPINFTDPGFNPAYVADFELLILINQHTFSYAVRHSTTKMLVRVSTGNLLNELLEPIEGSEIVGPNYNKVRIAVDSNSFCLVPNAVFNTENLLDYAAFLSVKKADLILTDQIETGQNTVIFTFSAQLLHKLEAVFGGIKIEFAPKNWVKAVFEAKLYDNNLYLFFKGERLQILFLDGENIKFYNQFESPLTDETVYFTALVAKQLHLKNEETNIILCGDVEPKSAEMLRLKEFFKNVYLFESPSFNQRDSLQQQQVINFLGF